ncbi:MULTISPECIES: LysR family transcriptional regulator [Methylomonas]|uniref:LysR family transcriptional regulator n=1 Tax=Methylomonas TaxID=416 RepID=UPI0007C88FA9|nr:MULTISPECIES: LysR family transcriptional regulator [Methylomonas]ANE56337.1 LysR family transcriptional regulator [Methylomonas sp. DH-1]WNB77195.1 LysR family transcriptional regulator [Methylomonas koyamae]BBL57740.1 transcriptional regulator [Methylomonas koyamae]
MDIDQIRTFLSVAANGSFLEAANRLYVTQSTVSTRIQRLEAYLGVSLFVRNRAGASLTQPGQRFLRHAKALLLTLEQARHDIGLPSRFRDSVSIGARIALCEGLLPEWIGAIRRQMPDVSIRTDIGFEEDLMRSLISGALDIGMMYTPQHSPGLLVEHIFDETLLLLSTDPDRPWPNDDYIFVDWAPGFYAQHSNAFPNLERSAQVVNIGWMALQLILAQNSGSCFLPIRLAAPLLQSGRLHPVADSPRFTLPAYMVSGRDNDSPVLQQVLAQLRGLATAERQKDYSALGS